MTEMNAMTRDLKKKRWFFPQYGVKRGSGQINFNVRVLQPGKIAVRAHTVIELYQETYHCFFRQRPDHALPLTPDEVCRLLSADLPPEDLSNLLSTAGYPLPADTYDVLLAPLRFESRAHQGVRVSCPAEYQSGFSDYTHDAHGVYILKPGSSRKGAGYGNGGAQERPGTLYRGMLETLEVVALPLVAANRLVAARVSHYAAQLRAGGCPTVLAFGFYANDRSLVLAVVDGHHKLEAAAQTGQPVYVLAYLSPLLMHNYEAMTLVQDAGGLSAVRQYLGELAEQDSGP